MRTLEEINAEIKQAVETLNAATQAGKKAMEQLLALRQECLPYTARHKIGDRVEYHGHLIEIEAIGLSPYGTPRYEARKVLKTGQLGTKKYVVSEHLIGPHYNGPSP